MSDSEIDDVAHELLLKSIATGKVHKPKVHKKVGKVSTDDLLGSLKTVKKSAKDVKKALHLEKKEATKAGAAKTLAAPIHRQALERIQGAVGYIELKKDLHVWKDVVETNRLKEQLVFPLHQEGVLSVDTAADKAAGFTPKTDMEKEMAAILNNSKHNMNNDTVYTAAELEIIKAMNLKEAKEKLSSMQKMRALVSYREAKYRYQKKIKSKGYHRVLKRAKRKQLVKEFDELLVRDPEAAKAKLAELETMRVLERGSLRHHARSKFHMSIMKHAANDPTAKKFLEENLRLGRDLKDKVGLESSSDESDEDEGKASSIGDIIKSAALAAASAQEKEDSITFDENESRQRLFEMRAKKRAELQQSKVASNGKVGTAPRIFEQDDDWTVVTADDSTQPVIEDEEESKSPIENKKKKLKKKKAKSETETTSNKNIDEIFAEQERHLEGEMDKLRQQIRKEEEPEVEEEEPKKKKKKKESNKEKNKKPDELAVDISLDPKHFLQVETSNLAKVSADLVETMDAFDEDQERLVAEAFKDDDVIAEFEQEKEFIEEGERPKDIDLTLKGWGCWVGPGIDESKRRKRFIIKAKEKRRRDQNKSGVIIREKDDEAMEKLQPRSLPFPYTRVEDFQAVMSQPIGKDWNPTSVSQNLCKPAVVTQGGRSIRPIDKAEAIKKRIYESENEDE